MRRGPWFIVGACLLAAIFWPWLLVFVAILLIVALAGLFTKKGR